MKVLLIQPNDFLGSKYYEPALSLLYLAASLNHRGIPARICDIRLSGEEELCRLLKEAPCVIGFGTTSYTMTEVARCARLVKAKSPKSIIVLGGAHATYASQEALKAVPEADYVVMGEAENTLCELALCLRKDPTSATHIVNVCARGNLKSFRPCYVNIDSIPFAITSLSMLDLPKVLAINPYIPMITSRGCYYKCKFCVSPSFWGNIRIRSSSNIRQELNQYANMGIQHINFRDDTFLMIPSVINRVVPDLGMMGFEWSCETRIDHIGRSLIESCVSNGLRKIRVSIETIHPKSHAVLGKGKMPELSHIKNIVSCLSDHGVEVRVSFMVGIPGETVSNIYETINFAESLKPATSTFWAFTPLPGTFFAKEASNFGVESVAGDFHPKRSSIHTDCISAKEIDEILAATEKQFIDPTWRKVH